MKQGKRWVIAILAFVLALPLSAVARSQTLTVNAADTPVVENGAYTSMQEVAVYLTEYGQLPANFITKKQAQALGWDSRAGNLSAVAPGKSIGGDYFGNYEGNVPDASGRKWTECDIDSDGGYRNGQRIVFSNDGLIYYSDDHYQTFRQVLVTVAPAATATQGGKDGAGQSGKVVQGRFYTARDDVAAYLNLSGALPDNYLTRDEAKALGWTSKKDNLGAIAPGYVIGGDEFGNREGLLPKAKNRTWQECDVNVDNGKRSNERVVWSNDGLIYYTPDNHATFQQLY